ncbi:MAG: hypothetical protein AAFZ07_02230 [Actinomycetota bacterium]
MTPSHQNLSLVALAAIVAAVGVVDAIVSGEADFVAVFGVILLLLGLLLLQTRSSRVRVSLRADLVRWLRRRSAASGEPLETIADRALAAYRAQFVRDVDVPVDDVVARGSRPPAPT